MQGLGFKPRPQKKKHKLSSGLELSYESTVALKICLWEKFDVYWSVI